MADVNTYIEAKYVHQGKLNELLRNLFGSAYSWEVKQDWVVVTAARGLTQASLEKARQQSSSARFFIDFSSLLQIFRKDVVKNILEQCLEAHSQHLIPDVVTQIVENGNGISLFAVLVWLDTPQTVLQFEEAGEIDVRLPLDNATLSRIAPEVTRFFETQWEFVPHYFQRNRSRVVSDLVILPFLTEVDFPNLDGSSGSISRVSIPSSMHNLLDHKATEHASSFVRKRIRPRKSSANHGPPKELNCLQVLSKLKHPNIVELLYAFKYQNEQNYLFPSLDMDLRQFLQEPTRYGAFSDDRTFYEALQGLCSALESLHNVRLNQSEHGVDMVRLGYHHDLRPSNVLVTPKTFKLADFGLSSIKILEQGSQTDWKYTVGDYVAPECMDLSLNAQRVGRPIDVWAFGCLVVEVATYKERGAAAVEEAREGRKSRDLNNRWTSDFFLGDNIKPEVLTHIEALMTSHCEETAKLMIVAKKILQIHPNDRPAAKDVNFDLEMLIIWSLIREINMLLQECLKFFKEVNLFFEVQRFHVWHQVVEKDPNSMKASSQGGKAIGSGITAKIHDLLVEMVQISQSALAVTRTNPSDDLGPDTAPDTLSDEPLSSSPPFHRILQDVVQRLCSLLPERLQEQHIEFWQTSIISTNSPQDLKRRAALSQTFNQAEYDEIAMLATMKSQSLAFQEFFSEHETLASLLLNRTQIEDQTVVRSGDDEISVGWLKQSSKNRNATYPLKIRVLIETAPCGPTWMKMKPDERASNISRLAILLNSSPDPDTRLELKKLTCLGFIEPENVAETFTLVHAFPGGVSSESQIPETLLSQYQRLPARNTTSTRGEGPKRPFRPLAYRVALAQTLARSLHSFHAVGYLHKALNPVNILFFSPPSAVGTPNLASPFFVNFHLSRPDDESAATTGPGWERDLQVYQHPEYICPTTPSSSLSPTAEDEEANSEATSPPRPRFCKAFDYYSLGIILLEIGSWDSIQWFVSRHPGLTPQQFRDILLEKYVPRLDWLMGRLYMEATRSCLSGRMESTAAAEEGIAARTEGDDIAAEFFVQVVQPLAEIRVA